MNTHEDEFSPLVLRFISHEGYAFRLAVATRRALLDEEASVDDSNIMLIMFKHVLTSEVFAASMTKEWTGTSLIPAIMIYSLRQMCSGSNDEEVRYVVVCGMLRILR